MGHGELKNLLQSGKNVEGHLVRFNNYRRSCEDEVI